MIRLFGLGVGIGAGIQAFRNYPADGIVSARTACVLALVAIVCAFFGGSRRAGAVAVASAEATAVAAATNTVNFAVVVPGQGAGSQDFGVRIPAEGDAPWLTGTRPQFDASEVLDGMESSEIAALAEEVE